MSVHGQQRRAVDRDQRRGERERGLAPTRLTLGAVTDPGTDTVTSYVVHWGDGNSTPTSTNGAKTHTYADGPATAAITVDLVDEDGTFLDRANAHVGHGRQRRAVDRDQRRGERERGLVYSLTLGAVTDPGTDTVTSYVVHWGDGNSRHLRRPTASRRTPTPTARQREPITVDLVDEDGTFLDRANAHSVTVDNVAPDDRDQRRGERERGLVLQPDPGRGHRPGRPTRSRATSCTGATATADTYAHQRRQDAHLRRRPGDHERSRSTWSTRTAPSSTRQRALGHGRQRRPDDRDQRRAQRERGLAPTA